MSRCVFFYFMFSKRNYKLKWITMKSQILKTIYDLIIDFNNYMSPAYTLPTSVSPLKSLFIIAPFGT